ncbi:MAG: GNAT family N-acetyltransferase [Gaiellaceae bacterium]
MSALRMYVVVEIVPFADNHVDDAGRLLAERHRAHLAVEHLLPRRTDFTEQIKQEREDATGVVAVEGREVVGYLLGKRREDFLGPHVWSYVSGHAVREPELVRDLYAAAARRWVEDGLTRHFVFVPAIRDLVEPWLRVTFGISGALAARGTVPEKVASEFSVRLGTAEDVPVAAALDRTLAEHLRESPSFSFFTVPSEQEYLDEWHDVHADPDYTHFVAERGGDAAGHLLLYRRPEGDLRVPSRSIDLFVAATDPSRRGGGAGVALTNFALHWAHEQGYTAMTTDWRMSNLAASRFWPRRGFRETHLRLYRSLP